MCLFYKKENLLWLFVHLSKSSGKSWNCVESPGKVLESWGKNSWKKWRKVLESRGFWINFFGGNHDSYAGLAVYLKEGLHLAWDLSLENSADSYLHFRLALLHLVFYFFFLYWSPSSSLFTVFESVSSSIDEVLLINHLLMFLSLETLT